MGTLIDLAVWAALVAHLAAFWLQTRTPLRFGIRHLLALTVLATAPFWLISLAGLTAVAWICAAVDVLVVSVFLLGDRPSVLPRWTYAELAFLTWWTMNVFFAMTSTR